VFNSISSFWDYKAVSYGRENHRSTGDNNNTRNQRVISEHIYLLARDYVIISNFTHQLWKEAVADSRCKEF
jgi:hypothetical protein